MCYLIAIAKIRKGAETNTTVALFHDEARAVLEVLESLNKVPTFAPPSPTVESIRHDQEAQKRRDRALPIRRKRS